MKSTRPKVGLLALTLELYETLAPQLRRGREDWLRRDVLSALKPVADVNFTGAVFRRADVESVVSRFEAEGVDALLVVLLTYSPSQIALPALARTRLPILIWNVQELFAVDEAFDQSAMIDNHGVHGTQDLANVLLRSGVRFEYITSHLRDSGATERLGDFFAAAATVRRLGSARAGLLGYPFPGMGDFALDTTRLAATLGVQVVQLSVEEYVNRSAAAESVSELISEYRRCYDVAPGVRETDLEATGRAELALRGMVADHKLDALTYQFMAFGEDERTETVPFVATSRLMAEGIAFGGEGDVIAAAGTLLLNCLQPPATFSEIFTVDFAGNAVFMSHMGEANAAMARKDRRIPLVARSLPITRTRRGQLALVTTLQPGPATFFALTLGPEARWRLLASQVEIADFAASASMEVPYFKLKARGDVRGFLTSYAKAGGPHHNAVCFGDARRRLRDAAALLDAEYIEV